MNRRDLLRAGLAATVCCSIGRTLGAPAKKRVVFVAGPGSHGYGNHDFEAGSKYLAHCLNKTGRFDCTVLKGWPKDTSVFANADAVIIFCDGLKKHVINGHESVLDDLSKRGVGLGFLHYATVVPKGKQGEAMLRWAGGYYEPWWSVNPFWTAEFKKFTKHPVTRGVKPFAIHDEWYYHMRFRPEMKGVTPVLTAVPPESTRKRKHGPHSGNPTVQSRTGMAEHLSWVSENEGGSRGFGFTGGHYHWNWGNNQLRKLTLNAIAWLSKADVPPQGIASVEPGVDELAAFIRSKPPANWNRSVWDKKLRKWNQK